MGISGMALYWKVSNECCMTIPPDRSLQFCIIFRASSAFKSHLKNVNIFITVTTEYTYHMGVSGVQPAVASQGRNGQN